MNRYSSAKQKKRKQKFFQSEKKSYFLANREKKGKDGLKEYKIIKRERETAFPLRDTFISS